MNRILLLSTLSLLLALILVLLFFSLEAAVVATYGRYSYAVQISPPA
jgi:hypothetical protein